jgi:hypothetical protein
MSHTLNAKLSCLQSFIDEFGWARKETGSPEQLTLEILKEIHADLRARKPGAAIKALQALEFQVDQARKAKARLGYVDVGHHQALGNDVLAHWPVIRRGLELAAETETTR